MPRRALTTCSAPGCGELVEHGRCSDCSTAAERQRGSSSKRGSGKKHRTRFRAAVLERDICCVLHRELGEWVLATVADHWPLSRRELVEHGDDPDDPSHGRGLCHDCHSTETARLQPGGFNQEG
jgi:5-methylcytosine-specific restriction protein A